MDTVDNARSQYERLRERNEGKKVRERVKREREREGEGWSAVEKRGYPASLSAMS